MSGLELPGTPRTPGAVVRHLGTDVAEWVAGELAACALGDVVTWETSIGLMPDPNTGQPVPVLIIYTAMPSLAVLGQVQADVNITALQEVNEPRVRTAVRSAVARIREARRTALANGAFNPPA